MIFKINTRQAGINEDESEEANRLLRCVLSRFKGIASRGKVRFTDENGPKGGVDKRCLVSVKLKTAGEVMIRSDGRNYTEALTNCLERLGRAIKREIDRRRDAPIRINRRNPPISLQRDDITE